MGCRAHDFWAATASCNVRSTWASVYSSNSATTAPVAGLTDAGDVEPNGLPSELTQMTKKRRVSMGRPGPTMSSHQPGDGSAALDAACDKPQLRQGAIRPAEQFIQAGQTLASLQARLHCSSFFGQLRLLASFG